MSIIPLRQRNLPTTEDGMAEDRYVVFDIMDSEDVLAKERMIGLGRLFWTQYPGLG